MRRFLSDNSLALFFIALFFACALGDALTGWHVFNAEQREHHETTVSLWRYLVSSDFAEAMSENWESEFLQFTTFFVASIWLFQRGSAESKRTKRPRARRSGPAPADSAPGSTPGR
jgi:hypothetical protein